MATTDTSFYDTRYNPPPNALQTAGQYQGLQNQMIQNQILQQELPGVMAKVQSAQMDVAADKAFAQKVSQHTDANGHTKWLDVQSDIAKDPVTASRYDRFQPVINNQLEAVSGGLNENKEPISESRQNLNQKLGGGNVAAGGGQPTQQGASPQMGVATQQGDAPQEQQPQAAPQQHPSGPPTITTGVQPGYTSPLATSRENYDKVSHDATTAPGQTAAYNEVINLANNGVMSGTNLTRAYASAARNDPFHILTGATDETVKNQELQKWMSQGLLASGMPGSDARLQELQHGNLNPEQLTETLKEMAPFFKAVSEGALRKQDYYNSRTNGGKDLQSEPAIKQQWDNNYDPRWIQFDDLSSKKAQREFLSKHPDMIEKRQSHQTLQNMGVIGDFKGN